MVMNVGGYQLRKEVKMFVIENKKEYENTKEYLRQFITDIKICRKKYPNNISNFLNNGHIEQIKQFIKQLRVYRKKLRKECEL